MTRERIENAVNIINYAIDNNKSVSDACVACGYGSTYVKNIKALVYDKYENDSISVELFKLFDDAYSKYVVKFDGKVNKITKKPSNNSKKPDDLPEDINIPIGGEQLKVNENSNTKDIDWRGRGTVKTLKKLLKVTKVDLNVWQVKNHIINKWDVTSWKKGYPETIENYQVKAYLEKKPNIDETLSAVEVFKNMVSTYTPPVYNVDNYQTKKSKLNNSESNLLEVCIFDLHMGKLAWHGETGENYDTKIASERFLNALETLVARSKGFEIDKILFPIGNDFFNSDTILNTTTQGTPQDEDLRWQKTFSVGTRLLVDGINYLKQLHVPIDVLIIPGNHDFERSYYMGSFLEAWYNNDPMVNVNNGASPRKYYKFGKVLLGFTHGNEEKEASLAMLMANDIESKPMWSETNYHEWHLGHIHRKKNVKYGVKLDKDVTLAEDLGVTVRYLSSLSGTEEWHHKKGFVGSIKAADAFIWSDSNGLVAHINANLKE